MPLLILGGGGDGYGDGEVLYISIYALEGLLWILNLRKSLFCCGKVNNMDVN